MIRGGQNVVEQEGGAFDLIAPGTWDGFIIELGGRVPEDLRALLQWGGNRVARNRLRVFVGAVIAAGVGFGIAVENAKVPPKLKYVFIQYSEHIMPNFPLSTFLISANILN
jgi:hypothetical protein